MITKNLQAFVFRLELLEQPMRSFHTKDMAIRKDMKTGSLSRLREKCTKIVM